MKQFLAKTLDVLVRLFHALVQWTSWLVARLRSVNIDQPRGVALCIGLQIIVLVAFLVAFRRDMEPPSKPVQSGSAQSTPNESMEVAPNQSSLP